VALELLVRETTVVQVSAGQDRRQVAVAEAAVQQVLRAPVQQPVTAVLVRPLQSRVQLSFTPGVAAAGLIKTTVRLLQVPVQADPAAAVMVLFQTSQHR
jgi:hypothetical protein